MWLPGWLKKPARPPSTPTPRVRILGFCLSIGDRVLLDWLAKQHHWDLRCISAPVDGFTLASRSHFDIILCDRYQPGYPWREVMARLADSSPASCILLVSPVNDDHLWEAVLQHGGYDILIRPLSEDSAVHAVESALRFGSRSAAVL